MQPLTKHREVNTGGVVTSTAFSISMKDQAHIKSILRDTLYSDKIMAVLREYSANAWDAHRMAGKPELPIRVQLPTPEKPVLQIQDWGTGLSHEEVFEVFARYGASTKRDSNEAVGMLGIGSKSGFAYSDTFTIISCHNNKRRTYVAMLDESENDNISLLAEVDCTPEDTGVTIEIAVKPEDINDFYRKAVQLFQHFNPRPKINADLPKMPAIRAKMTHGVLFDKKIDNWSYEVGNGWFAIMGCVPYRIDLTQLKDSNGDSLIPKSFATTRGLLYFDIGQIQINASREDLKYSKITKDALVQKFNDLLDEYVLKVLEEIENGTGTNWEKRVHSQVLLELGLGKEQVGTWGLDHIPMKEYDTFMLRSYGNSSASGFVVASDTRFIRYTDIGRKKLSGFKLGFHDYLIVPKTIFIINASGLQVASGTHTWDEVNIELNQALVDLQAEGISIVDLPTLPWVPAKPRAYKARTVNPKHMKRIFVYNDKHLGSDGWDYEDHVPQDTDVFVILNHFNTQGVADQHFDFERLRMRDLEIAKILDLTPPKVYGYKTTEKKPLTIETTKGIHYSKWREEFYKNLKISPESLAKFQAKGWRDALPERAYRTISSEQVVSICNKLGNHHPISIFLQKADSCRNADPNYDLAILRRYVDNIKIPELEAEKAYQALGFETKYRLLARLDGLFYHDREDAYIQYIKLIDMEEQATRLTDKLSVSSVSEQADQNEEQNSEVQPQPAI